MKHDGEKSKAKCPNCKSEFEFEIKAIKTQKTPHFGYTEIEATINCPSCGNRITLW